MYQIELWKKGKRRKNIIILFTNSSRKFDPTAFWLLLMHFVNKLMAVYYDYVAYMN